MPESKHDNEPDEEPTTTGEDDPRDELVGRYTEVDGDGPQVRGVQGEYTRTDGAPDDEESVGDYVTTETNPHTHDASERPGKYTRADHGEPHHHKHDDE